MANKKLIIETKNLTREYKQGSETVFGVKDINLSIERGEFASIIGQSGSGKSTLLNLLGGIDFPTSGDIVINGLSTTTLNDKKLTKFRSQHIGFIFQQYNLIPELTVLENIRLPLDLSKRTYDEQYEEELIKLLGLDNRLNFRPYQLSGGQQQRVAIARALIIKPDIILADEPTGNLDKKSGDRFVEFMEKTNKRFGQTYIVVTHNPELAERTNRIITLEDGRIIHDTKQ